MIISRDILKIQFDYGLAFDAILQLATTLAIFVYFRKEVFSLISNFLKLIFRKKISTQDENILIAIMIGTLPAIFFGILLESHMESGFFRNSIFVAVMLIVGSVIMGLAERHNQKQLSTETEASAKNNLNAKKGFKIGLFQALALIPGMSRSGMTISGGLFSGLKRETATRFSFLLAMPILLGSGLKKLLDLNQSGILENIGVELLAGSVSAFIVGILAIHFLIKFLKNNSLKIFIYYRLILAGIILIFVFLN